MSACPSSGRGLLVSRFRKLTEVDALTLVFDRAVVRISAAQDFQ
jgi:hypothetical protein